MYTTRIVILRSLPELLETGDLPILPENMRAPTAYAKMRGAFRLAPTPTLLHAGRITARGIRRKQGVGAGPRAPPPHLPCLCLVHAPRPCGLVLVALQHPLPRLADVGAPVQPDRATLLAVIPPRLQHHNVGCIVHGPGCREDLHHLGGIIGTHWRVRSYHPPCLHVHIRRPRQSLTLHMMLVIAL